MGLFKLLQKKSKFFYLNLGVLGLINALWASALLLFINNKITGEKLPFVPEQYDWIVYCGLIVFSFIVARYFQAYMIKLTYELGNELNLSIFNKLRFTSYKEFLDLGEEKVRTAMEDVSTLQSFPQNFIETFNAAIMVTIGIIYLFVTHPLGAAVVLATLVTLAVIYLLRNDSIEKDIIKSRNLAEIYQNNVNDFLRGFREIKMSTKRSDTIYIDYMTKNRNNVKNLTVKTVTKFLVNNLMGSYAGHLMIGVILFALPAMLLITADVRTNFVITILYILGSVSSVVEAIEEFTKMKVAVTRLNEFNETLGIKQGDALNHGDMTNFNTEFKSIRFENVEYEYYNDKKEVAFKLKPLNLTITKGESIFITGGNGSGKSTFIMLLVGLYKPISGKIFLNDTLITANNYSYYRDQISCIFTDNYLFTENYNNFDYEKKDNELTKLVKEMQIERVFEINKEEGKVKVSLSKGQQKRVALIYSLLEEKEVLVLDEWAAEQDPEFRAYFYNVIIPRLKEQGKTVVSVTHDDAYFKQAKRLIKFNFGNIESDSINTKEKVKNMELQSM
ncbi:ATP-binding cassette domain-containing protein [Tenacibaculum ovolyticum]|uniref:ATP-binding cassette domain-containing protein n=1 Tax=Tenacibaculum ovolyticum TaxID=104270 RepID=UPI00048B10C2|nr:ATP-binding cassette domain-containing protein [Tenacibaculum ovolyticum]